MPALPGPGCSQLAVRRVDAQKVVNLLALNSQRRRKLSYAVHAAACLCHLLLEQAFLGVPGGAEGLAALGESGGDDGLEGVLLLAPPAEDDV